MNEDHWRIQVDKKLDAITSSLETLIRVEEKQTAMMQSHEALTIRVQKQDEELQSVAFVARDLQSVTHSINATSAEMIKMRDAMSRRLEALEADKKQVTWATKSIERLLAVAALVIAIASHFWDFGNNG